MASNGEANFLVLGIICGTIWDDLQSGDHLGACTSGLHRLSRTLGRLNALASSVDWLTGLSTSFMIGQGDVIGFGFTTYNRPFSRSNKQ